MIYPSFTNSIDIWGSTYNTNIFSLLAKQEKIVGIICIAKYLDHTSPLYLKLNTLQFPDIEKYIPEISMLDDFQNTSPLSLQDLST